MLQRVLRGHNQKQLGQRIGGHAHADLVFAHGLQQGRLHLGRCAIDLVGQYQIVEQRSLLELKITLLGPVDVGAGQVGWQHVGGELHALEFTLQALCQCLNGPCLGQARRTFDQQVPVAQQRNQQAFDQPVLAQNLGVEVIAQGLERCQRQAAGRLGVACGRVHGLIW